MRIRVQPYKAGSASARVLARNLGARRINLVHTRFRPRVGDYIINWGSSEVLFPHHFYVNPPDVVALAQCKLTSLNQFRMYGAPYPEFTTDRAEAQGWLDDGRKVVARRLLRGTQGRGICLIEPGGELPYAPLYTMYVKKRDEYRVHVFNGEVLDIQQKRRTRDFEGRDNQIRNHANGWTFCRNDVVPPPECVLDAARAAVASLGLDFGAADVGYNARYDEACVYEVNTAPGLEGFTIDRYVSAFRALIEEGN